MQDPSPDIMICIVLLAWVTIVEVKKYYKKAQGCSDDTMEADEDKERWKNPNYIAHKQNCSEKPYVKV